MKKIVNPYTTLYGVGALQPVSAGELRRFIEKTFDEAGGVPAIRELQDFLSEQIDEGRVVAVKAKAGSLYSLTERGNQYLSPHMRRLRDKFRAYLLRDAHRGRVSTSRTGNVVGLVGVAPTEKSRTSMKWGASNKLGSRSSPRATQVYWTRLTRQFRSETGPTSLVRDTFPRFVSYETPAQLRRSRIDQSADQFDYIGIGLCLSLSPGLISKIAYNPDIYYRKFSLRKKSGGLRTILSPRVFLKVVQWFLADFVFGDLPISEAVHSFRPDHSIVTNATNHVGRSFVANIDIENFFGSIPRKKVRIFLKQNGFRPEEAKAISRLVTCNDCLPQGAPTSPILSNAILFEFDRRLSTFAATLDVAYSRYADDITFSGEDRPSVQQCIDIARQELRRHGLKLNKDKTRIANKGGQQRVAGVVVNEKAAPPRTLRRNIRAAFHNARTNPREYSERMSELGGYIGYLNQFEQYQESQLLKEYKDVLARVRIMRRISRMRLEHLRDAL